MRVTFVDIALILIMKYVLRQQASETTGERESERMY
jgi:hypothetical protein